ncbi:ATP-binding cassette domain-containing protein [Exilibacterium tricleocarpae]|uniref:ATP-binding cassette domain-containing protein n=1 Tax=Exilibacterium tricleocarpae TaxID=2591008 RepID=A0A545TFF8_9GAMM|nr:ATP-binding cassette domain-containing protein [Exilibacterium tricleocarpae]TQV75950.1 ATP-binding cassette domain-containing protein [Exilibacterium tricleocarpae]
MSISAGLLPCLSKIAQLQGESMDWLAVEDISKTIDSADPQEYLSALFKGLYLPSPQWLSSVDVSNTPALAYLPGIGWTVVRGQNAAGAWIVQRWCEQSNHWIEAAKKTLSTTCVAVVRPSKPFTFSGSKVTALVSQEILSHKKLLLSVMLVSVVINTVGIAVSLYAMLVYDRVIPTGASQTLLVLTLGASIALIYEFVSKHVRSRLFETLIDELDKSLARTIYTRFLAIRLDQLPKSVGGLASQMRGYETIRSFITGATTHVLVDAPYALLFITVIFLIGGYLALIPFAFFCLAVSLGLIYKGRVAKLAAPLNNATNLRTGLLVETIEGAEAIKAGQSGWRLLSRWLENTDQARSHEIEIRRISERSQYLVGIFQQASFVALIASGALLVSKGELTMGALIACSILSGRVLAPVAQLPNQLIQWAHAKAAAQNLDSLWTLECDHHGHEQPLLIEDIKGEYRLEDTVVSYGEITALSIANLTIKSGEKVAVVGPVGSGKTTMLRLLAGLYKPQQGRVLLDGLDLSQLSKPRLAESMSYVQQEVRLFSGTVRENLILGLLDPGDDVILQAARKTGLFDALLARHPQGLYRPIYEGGTGLSGGQKQLLNLTRALLRDSSIWLLDEPTASMDQELESKVIATLKSSIADHHTLVLVTHKVELLDLVGRLIVIANHKVVLDGPKDVVLKKLSSPDPRMAASS